MAFSDSESFAVVSELSSQAIGPEYTDITSAKVADIDIQLTKALREHYPELCITVVPDSNAPLLAFAAAGFATAELDTKNETIFRWRGYVAPQHRGGTGQLGDSPFFAKYRYAWAGQDFIIYIVAVGLTNIQYILKEPDTGKEEHPMSNCAVSDALIRECAVAAVGDETDYIYVYDGLWSRSRELWEEVQKSSWDKVILDSKTKKALTNVTKSFFDSKDVYEKYAVPWKRGIIFYGPPGNGKTISVKALMKELSHRKDPIPTLYVKSAPDTYDIGDVFEFARSFSPCMLVMEDVETIVTPETRSYFFNEVDGLENNDGILMIATTNYLEKLDPGIAKRPSRFDRKFDFPLPSRHERILYGEFWRKKLAKKSPDIEFPEKLCPALADITKKFSFAYMQEAFVASLLTLAREDQDDPDDEELGESSEDENKFSFEATKDSKDPLDKYRLWRALKTNVEILRGDLDAGDGETLSQYPSNRLPKRNIAKELRTANGDQSLGQTLRAKAWENYFPQTQSELGRSGTVPGFRSRAAQQDVISTKAPRASRVGGRVDAFGRFSFPPRLGPRVIGETPARSLRAREPGPSQTKKSTEATSEDLYEVGVGKDQDLAETAFEWRPL